MSISTFHGISTLMGELYYPWLCFTSWDNSVGKKKNKTNTIPQPHKRTTTTYFLTLTFYSFADFFFLTAFPWDLTIGILLPCPSSFIWLSLIPPLPFPFSVSSQLSLLFCGVMYKADHQSSRPFACKFEEYFTTVFKFYKIVTTVCFLFFFTNHIIILSVYQINFSPHLSVSEVFLIIQVLFGFIQVLCLHLCC